MKPYAIFLTAALLPAMTLRAAEEVAITGTYQIQVACHESFHEEIVMLEVAGADKFSAERHVLKLTPDMKKGLRLGQTITVKGKRQKSSKQKMAKGQLRRHMVECLNHGKGLPYQCAEMGEIIAGIRMEAKAPAAAHDHGELRLKAVADDHEIVEVQMVEHIEVTQVELNKGKASQ